MAWTPIHKPGEVVDDWTLLDNLGVGGNGEAWRVRSPDGEMRVMKLLRPGGERYDRFRREVEAVRALVEAGFPALPIESEHLPDRPSKDEPAYYVMPEATRIDRALADADVPTKVDAVSELAEALARLQEEHGRHHRDVKPANMYLYDGKFVLGDFGLVTDPEAVTSLTVEGRALGPWAFLPSEAITPPPNLTIDEEKIDVHCLAMSLWCLIVGSEQPPRRIEPRGITSLSRQLVIPPPPTGSASVDDPEVAEMRTHVAELDGILSAATADDPEARPTLQRFAVQLQDWSEGVAFRGQFRAYVARAEDDEETVLHWLVATARHDQMLGLNIYDVADGAAPSPVEGLTNERFSIAIGGLVQGYYAVGEASPTAVAPLDWSKVYPTHFGVERVERDRIEAETSPVLRAIAEVGPLTGFSFSGNDEAVAVGDLVPTGAELYFLLRYLDGAGLIEFTYDWESGPGVVAHVVRLTNIGRRRVAASEATRITTDQTHVLDAVNAFFAEHGVPPTFKQMSTLLDRRLHLRLKPVAESLPRGLLYPDVGPRGGFFRDEDQLMVTFDGLAFCTGGGAMLDLLARVVGYFADREQALIPDAAGTTPDLIVTRDEVARDLSLSPLELKQAHDLVNLYESRVRSVAGHDGNWHFVIDQEVIRDYRGIRTGEQLRQVHAGTWSPPARGVGDVADR